LLKRRILLVDDEVAILLTLKAILEINGFEVETAASAKEAKLKLRNHVYHMVITDMRMESDTAGSEVTRAAKNAPYRPAVALLTAFPLPGSEWQEDGADEMLVKPMNTSDLVRQLEAMLISHEDKKHRQEDLLAARKAAAKERVSASSIPGR
jgi:DNA-binding response OmpR family regulator